MIVFAYLFLETECSMRSASGLLLLLLLAGCETQPTPTLVTLCSNPRPQVCTMEYAPACGSLVAGGFRTYASPCSACSDPAVAGYQAGPCSE